MVVAVAAVLFSTHVSLFEDAGDDFHHHHHHHQHKLHSAEREDAGVVCASIAHVKRENAACCRRSVPPPHHQLLHCHHHTNHAQQQQPQRVSSSGPFVGLRVFPQVSGTVSAFVPTIASVASNSIDCTKRHSSHFSSAGARPLAAPPGFAAGSRAPTAASPPPPLASKGGGRLNISIAQCVSKDRPSSSERGSSSSIGLGGLSKRADVVTKVSYTTAFRESTDSPSPTESLAFGPSLSLPPRLNDRADDISLHNPLLRLERLGCGWFALIMEWEGVVVEEDPALDAKVWGALAEEEGRAMPMAFMLRRAEGMKNEQVLSQVLCWARETREVRRLARRKEEIYEEMSALRRRANVLPGVMEFIRSVKKHGAPVALVSTRPRQFVEKAMKAAGFEPGTFDAVITAEDVERGKPDPEMYLYAAQVLRMIPERSIVLGNAHSSIEAAHDVGMKCVAVVGRHAAYELHEAEAVVRRLSDLSFQHLKSLISQESRDGENGFGGEPQPQMEEEVERELPRVSFADW